MDKHRLGTAAALALVWTSPAYAGGFYIQEQSPAAVGRAQAGNVAAADDASTIYYNPAGMTELHDVEITIGSDIVIPSVSLTNTGSTNRSTGAYLANPAAGGFVPANGGNGGDPGSAQAVPDLYVAVPFDNSNFVVGLGITSPFGLVSQYTPDSFARYDSTESFLETVDVAPSIAVKANDWLSIGVGIDAQYAHVKLATALPNPLNPGGPTPMTDGRLTVRGHDWATGYNVGLLLDPTRGLKLGVSYRSGITHQINGTVDFEGLTGPLALRDGVIGGSADLNLPDIISGGFSQRLTSKFTLLGEVDYYGWSKFKQIAITPADGSGDLITPENYRNTYSAALGGEYQVTERLKLRAGFKYDESPTVNGFRDTRVPDGDRYWLAGGFGFRLSRWADLEASYAHIFVRNTAINLTRSFYATAPFPIPTTSNIVATSQPKIDIVTVGFNFHL